MNHVYSVSQINQYIKNMFQSDYALNNIYIKGEVSNCKYHTSGHIYFTLKDEKGGIACVMFSSHRSGLAFRLQEGQSIIVLGSVNVYERDGKYQLYAREIILDGLGILYAKFEQLKNELEEEGLFDPIYKREIPAFPKRIGIVTAKTGAAIRDIMNIANRRNPYVQLILYPALVQGDGATTSIVNGIHALDRYGVDTIIVGRGGGSIEDLWAFNEEIVARAIFNCSTPIISAVGHETDTTIADFVADLRAPTPSAAAELAVTPVRDLYEKIEYYNKVLNNTVSSKILFLRGKLENYHIKLEHLSPIYQIRQNRQQLMDFEEKLQVLMQSRVREKKHELALYAERFDGLSPIKKLSQGFAYVSDDTGRIVKRMDDVKISDQITIAVTDGDIIAKVEEKHSRRRR